MMMFPRHLLPLARQALDVFPILVIEGARQVGKSTFAQLLVADRPSRMVTLDEQQQLDAARADPQAFVGQFPDQTLVIDEVQRVPELILAVKLDVDRNRRPGRFVLTGSSDLLRLERTPDSLAGRATTLHLGTLSQGELAGQSDDFVSSVRQGRRPADFATTWQREDYAAALVRGGYPELQSMPERFRRTWIDGYLDRMIQRDAADIAGPVSSERLRSVLRLVAANQAGELVKARLASQAEIPANSITTHVDLLRTLFLTTHLPPWTPNLTRRETGRPKAFVTDPALAMRLNLLTPDQVAPLTGREHLGALLEAFVAAELFKQKGWSEEDYELFHYRDRNGLEVDLVIELGDGSVVGVEVKAAATLRSDDFAGLKSFAQRLGPRFLAGFVVGTGGAGFQHSPRLFGLPVAALWQWH